MSFGLICRNDDNYTQIDSALPNLSCVYQGDIVSSMMQATVVFPSPIKTTYAPCLFIRHGALTEPTLMTRLAFTGSSGNWTGFHISTNNIYIPPTGKWFVAVFGVPAPTDGFGLRVFDESGLVTFDSNAPSIIVTKVNTSWEYNGYIPGLATNTYRWRALVSALSGEYMLCNPFSRHMLSSNGGWALDVGFRMGLNAGDYTYLYADGDPPQTDVGYFPAIFARLVKN